MWQIIVFVIGGLSPPLVHGPYPDASACYRDLPRYQRRISFKTPAGHAVLICRPVNLTIPISSLT